MYLMKQVGLAAVAMTLAMPLKGMEAGAGESEIPGGDKEIQKPVIKKPISKDLFYFIARDGSFKTLKVTKQEIQEKIGLLKEIAEKAGVKPGGNIAMLLYLRYTTAEKAGSLAVSGRSAPQEDVTAWEKLLSEHNLISETTVTRGKVVEKIKTLDPVIQQLLVVTDGSLQLLDWELLLTLKRILNRYDGKAYLMQKAKKDAESDHDGDVWYFRGSFGADEFIKVRKDTIKKIYKDFTSLKREEFNYITHFLNGVDVSNVDQAIIDSVRSKGLLGKDGKPKLLVKYLYASTNRPLTEISRKKMSSVADLFIPLKQAFKEGRIYRKLEEVEALSSSDPTSSSSSRHVKKPRTRSVSDPSSNSSIKKD